MNRQPLTERDRLFILDTNVVSELIRPVPNRVVQEWVDDRLGPFLYISAVTQAELLYGVDKLDEGRRKGDIRSFVERMLYFDYYGRILPFDSDAAWQYAEIVITRQQAGRPVRTEDCMIAAIAKAHGMAVVTRNVRDFEGVGVDVIDPWAGGGGVPA